MKRLILILMVLSTSASAQRVVSVTASLWRIPSAPYSTGMPNRPSPADQGWSFSFPTAPGSHVDYVETNIRGPIVGSSISIIYQITGVSPVWTGHVRNGDGCDQNPVATWGPLIRTGNDLTWAPNRWWSNIRQVVQIEDTMVVTYPLKPEFWITVNGTTGDYSAVNQTAFSRTLRNATQIGLTFGGCNNYGHGVRLISGSAVFNLIDYTINP